MYQSLGISKGSCIPRGQNPVREWASLQQGDLVEVWSNNSLRYAAYVDDRADDGRLLWVIDNGTGSRRLFIQEDRVTLYPIYEAQPGLRPRQSRISPLRTIVPVMHASSAPHVGLLRDAARADDDGSRREPRYPRPPGVLPRPPVDDAEGLRAGLPQE
jgi:hypothetical protein